MKKHIVLRTLFVSFFLLCATTMAFPQTPFLWEQTNGPEGGGVQSLAINSQGDIFASAEMAGVFRSTDNGENWSPVNNHENGLDSDLFGGGKLALHPDGTLFFANGSRIFRSTNNGDYWTLTNFFFAGYGATSMVIRSDGVIFVGTGANGVVRSDDKGDSWQKIPGLGDVYVGTLALGPSGAVYAGTQNGVYLSMDGNTWAPSGLEGTVVRGLGVKPDGRLFVGTADGNVWHYDNSGWTAVPLPTVVTSFAFHQSGAAFAGGVQNGGVWRSIDNGDSWTCVGLGQHSNDIANGVRSVYAFGINSSGDIFAATGDGVFRSQDHGSTWALLARGMRATTVRSLLGTAQGSVLAGTDRESIFRSGDKGGNWTRVAPNLIDDCWSFWSMATNSSGQLFAVYSGGPVTSSDDGNSWQPMDSVPCPVGDCYRLAVAVDSSDRIYVAGREYVARSSDNGVSWELLALTGDCFGSMAISPNGTIFVGTIPQCGGAKRGLFRSTDDGLSFQLVGFKDDYYIKSIAINSSAHVFVATAEGVERSTDNGSSWDRVRDLDGEKSIAINSEDRVFVGLLGGGVISSTDSGNTWTELNDGLTQTNVHALGFDSEGYLYAGTWGGGVWRSTETTFLVKTVAIDIKPGTYPNTINLGSNGTAPVAILSSETFDATTIDPLTVTLAGANVRLKGKGTPMSSFEDINKDGRLDLLVHVETEALELTDTSTEAVLEGKTFSGRRIKGTDTVKVVP